MTDPISGRNFDGRYDGTLDCGCVVFYLGATALCENHSSQSALRQEQELAELIDAELHAKRECNNTIATCPKLTGCECATALAFQKEGKR